MDAPGDAGDVFGTTFAHPHHLARRRNDDRFEVPAQLESVLRDRQDVVVLRRR